MTAWECTCRFVGRAGGHRHVVLARSGEPAAFLESVIRLGQGREWRPDPIHPLEGEPVPCQDPALAAILTTHREALLTAARLPMVHVTTLDGVEPLDQQFGVYPKLDAPKALAPWLSGASGLDCFALLDGAKVDNLPQMLAGSLLEYQSLFQGKAQQELGEVAPYLVRLAPENPFTRRLFTRPGPLGGLWGMDAGVLLLSRAPLAALRRQLRKYTRIQDDAGKWYYYRFWEPRVFRANAGLYDAATFRAFLGPVEAVLCPGRTETEVLLFELPLLGMPA